ncbi:MAG TPA: TPM domain-containing protein [Gemmatimonadaceae bacterium]|nr:TPM domain-containing protein [Gemmatimonadaceae bacterium]
MITSLLWAALLIGPPASDTGRLAWVPNPRTTNGSWVSDPAHHLQPRTVAAIDSTVLALEREAGAEIAVVVIDSLDDLDPSQAALTLHRRWGVGKGNRDNGIVFLWSPKLRKTFVSVGYGLEGVLPDARAGRIQDEAVIPAFRRGDFDGGVLAGVRALASAAREETYSGMQRQQFARPATSDASSRRSTIVAIWTSLIAFVLGVLALIVGIVKYRRYRPRKCRNGHPMRRLDESADDSMLAREQLLEEGLRSVDYDVWVCDTCGDKQVIPYQRWFSGYEVCTKCKRRTCKRTQTVLVAPTFTSDGKRRVVRDCRNCGHHDDREVAIPHLQSSSGGSSGGSGGGGGGGSSFGGGSSGGGGAGRSY